MITRPDSGRDFLRYQHGSHRQATRQRLGEGEHVGNDAGGFVREKMPGAPEPALDLVENEGDLSFRGQLAKALQEIRIENADSALALNRLDDDRRDCLLIENRLEVAKIPLANRDPARQGTEWRAIGGTIRRRKRCEEPAVEASTKSDYLDLCISAGLPRPSSRKLERAFVRLGARVT